MTSGPEEVPPAHRHDPDQVRDATPPARRATASPPGGPPPDPVDRTTSGRPRWVAAGEAVAAYVGR